MAYKSRATRFSEAVELVSTAKDTAISALESLRDESEEGAELGDQVSEIVSTFESDKENAKSEIESLKDEIDNWKSGLEGTNLENSDKYQRLSDCVDALDDAISQLENDISADDVDGAISDLESIDISDDIDFPGMFN